MDQADMLPHARAVVGPEIIGNEHCNLVKITHRYSQPLKEHGWNRESLCFPSMCNIRFLL